ncbi:MAG TPA: glycosyltransferase family 1 protein, partial [Isosphaeraceae bacterium]|nr:glycosyltransferase family 1 protein [Isosphaeraceae bacterium]
MRIGIDMMALQAPASRPREAGRFAAHLVGALLEHAPEHEFVLYAHDGLPAHEFPRASNARVINLARASWIGRSTAIHKLANANPQSLETLLVLDPFETYDGYHLPPKPLHGPKIVALVHDLVPLLFPEQYLGDHFQAARFHQHLALLRHYDLLLTPSEATRAELTRLLGVRPARTVVTGGAGDPSFGPGLEIVPPPLSERRTFAHFGIKGRFVFSVASPEYSKNLRGLIDAFGMLPPRLIFNHQLVIACQIADHERAEALACAFERGVGEKLVFTGELSGETLALLYQHCAAYVSASFHEGFSMPLLEALQCGAPVVAGHNSAQAELTGQAGLLVNVHDPADMAAHIGKVLADPDLAHELKRRALERAAGMSWAGVARTTIQALAATTGNARKSVDSRPTEFRRQPRLRVDRPRGARPRLAIFSPWPPKGSGISDYATRLVRELLPHYSIDLFHDSGYVPEPALASLELGCHDYRVFERLAATVPYHRILYQMGNSLYHRFMYPTMLRYPGVVTLHDFCLSGFQHWFSLNAADRPDYLEAELRHCHPEQAEELIAS